MKHTADVAFSGISKGIDANEATPDGTAVISHCDSMRGLSGETLSEQSRLLGSEDKI